MRRASRNLVRHRPEQSATSWICTVARITTLSSLRMPRGGSSRVRQENAIVSGTFSYWRRVCASLRSPARCWSPQQGVPPSPTGPARNTGEQRGERRSARQDSSCGRQPLERAGRLAAEPGRLPEPARTGSPLPGLDRARVLQARLGRGPLHFGRGRHGAPAGLLACHGYRLQQGRAGGGEPAGAALRRERPQPDPAGPRRRRAHRPRGHVGLAPIRGDDRGWAHARSRRQRHEVGRVRHGVRARCAAHSRLPARRRRLCADRDGGGEHRQRRAVDAGARLSRRRLPDPGADRRPRSCAAPWA